MASLPRLARSYLVLMWISAIAILAAIIPNLTLTTSPIWIICWIIGFVFADFFEVPFEVAEGGVGMTIAEAIVIFLVAVAGTTGVLVVALSTLIVEILRKRPWYRAGFNISTRTITMFLIVQLYTLLHNPNSPIFGTPWEMIIFLAIAAAFYITSAILVGLIVALASGQPIRTVYSGSYKLVQWIHLLTLPVGAVMASHWHTNRWLLVFDVVVLLIAQRSFVMVAELQKESQRRQELADERERLYKELQAQQEELVRASKLAALGTFSSGIAHEFNNLLAVIMGHAQLGLVTNQPSEMRESLDLTVRACRRGRSITQGLLTFARQGETQRSMQQIRELIDDTLAMVEHDFAKEQVLIERRLEPVPATYCDPGQIVQVVLNMLSNARDAMREHGGVITIGLRRDENSILLSIADTGTGIPADIQQQIFQPFVTTKAPGKGTGLGLAVCYGIIESHNGAINVASTLGKGTTMTIRLPIIERHQPGIIVSPQDAARLLQTAPTDTERAYQQ